MSVPMPAMTMDEQKSAYALPEILSALSFALDQTEGAIPVHALRSTLLGMRFGTSLQLSPDLLESLYYALQLKDIGCSSNAFRMAEITGVAMVAGPRRARSSQIGERLQSRPPNASNAMVRRAAE